MASPRGVATQADQADERIRQLAEARAQSETGHYDNAPTETADGRPANVDPEPAKNEGTVQPQNAAQPEQAKPQGEEVAYWRHRFDVLQGKYNAEVPALRKEIGELKTAIEQAQGTQPGGSAASRAKEAVSDLTAEEIEEFGPELVDMVRRVAASSSKVQAAPEADPELRNRLERMERETLEDKQARFFAALDTRVRDWRDVDNMPEFGAWLDQYDTLRGATRRDMLATAYQSLNVESVIALFESFPRPGKAAAREIPRDQIQPPAGSRGEDSSAPQARTWTKGEIAQYYRDVAANKLSPEQAKNIEADIFAAQRENRIRA